MHPEPENQEIERPGLVELGNALSVPDAEGLAQVEAFKPELVKAEGQVKEAQEGNRERFEFAQI